MPILHPIATHRDDGKTPEWGTPPDPGTSFATGPDRGIKATTVKQGSTDQRTHGAAMQITKELLKDWNACREGYGWFLEKFPQGGSYAEVNKALRAEKRYDDSSWLTNLVFSSLLDKPDQIASLVKSEVDSALEETKDSPNSASGDYSTAVSSGDYSTAASSGNSSKAASSGDYSKAASSGNSSKAASSGDYSTAASSGDSSTAASSGDSSTAASSGDSSTAAATGKRTVAMVAGINGQARAGEQGAFALAWQDGEQMRIAVGIVGENGIKPDTMYCVSKTGELQEVGVLS